MSRHSLPSRREFLNGLAVCGAGLMVPVASSQKKQGPRLAVRGPFQERELSRRAELLAQLGYKGIELGPEYVERSPGSLLADVRKNGIEVSGIVGSLQLLNPDPAARLAAVELDRKRLHLAAELGASVVIEVPVFGERRFQDPGTPGNPYRFEDDLLVEGLRQLAGTVAETGVSLILEPLTRRETYFLNHQRHGARLIRSVGAAGFGLLSDFYHMQMEEDDIPSALAEVKDYVSYVHLADGEARLEPGSLPFDYRPGFRVLKTAGYSGWLTVESGASDTPDAALARARSYLEEQWERA